MSVDDFVALLGAMRTRELSTSDLPRRVDEVPGWDSVHPLCLSTTLEQRTGRHLSLRELHAAESLEQLHARAVA
jgi:hypothetical protein